MENKKKDNADKIVSAIKEKYGPDVDIAPREEWDQEKERRYLEDLKKIKDCEDLEEVDEGEYKTIKRIIETDKNNVCHKCGKYGLKRNDDVYLGKYGFCAECYIKFYQGSAAWWEERQKGKIKNEN